MNKVFAAIVALYHRIIKAIIIGESRRITALGLYAEKISSEGKSEIEKVSADLAQLRQESEHAISTEVTALRAEIARLLEAVRFVNATKRDSAGLRGDTHELLK